MGKLFFNEWLVTHRSSNKLLICVKLVRVQSGQLNASVRFSFFYGSILLDSSGVFGFVLAYRFRGAPGLSATAGRPV